jgi:hypothetical protein
MGHWTKKLVDGCACSEAIEWAKQYRSPIDAWNACDRGDWMLWVAGKLSGKPLSKKRKLLTLAKCECARLALNFVPKDEKRPLRAIQTAEAWAKGNDRGTTIEDVMFAASAAAYAAYANAYANASSAAASAAAYANAYAAANASAAAEKIRVLKICADIMRKHYPKPPK